MPDEEWNFASVPESFWKLIEDAHGDPDRFRALIAALSQKKLQEMYFQYKALAAQLFTKQHEARMHPDATEDTAKDIAEWVVAQGRKTYEDVRDHPEKTPRT